MYRKIGICFVVLWINPVTAAEIAHEKVQEALNWQLPMIECNRPRSISMNSAEDPAEGGKAQTDVDSYTIGRYERKKKRWIVCVDKYKAALMDDYEQLKRSAQHGLTKAQADIILGKMSQLQSAYMSADR